MSPEVRAELEGLGFEVTPFTRSMWFIRHHPGGRSALVPPEAEPAHAYFLALKLAQEATGIHAVGSEDCQRPMLMVLRNTLATAAWRDLRTAVEAAKPDAHPTRYRQLEESTAELAGFLLDWGFLYGEEGGYYRDFRVDLAPRPAAAGPLAPRLRDLDAAVCAVLASP